MATNERNKVLSNTIQDRQYLQEVGNIFKLPGEIKKIELLKDGSWATTYKVDYDTKKSYLFQMMKVPKEVLTLSCANAEMLQDYLKTNDLAPAHFHHTNRNKVIVDYFFQHWRVKKYFDSYKLSKLEVYKDFKELVTSFFNLNAISASLAIFISILLG